MKYCLILLLLFVSTTLFSKTIMYEDIQKIKSAMILAVKSPRVTDSLYSELLTRKPVTPLIMAYTGTLEALKAKHNWNPYQKIKYVAQSQKTLQKAIKADPNNLEIRFMRFSIQHYTPEFLGYSKELGQDRKMIIKQFSEKNYGQVDSELQKNIAKFMISSKRCTPEEIKLLKKYI